MNASFLAKNYFSLRSFWASAINRLIIEIKLTFRNLDQKRSKPNFCFYDNSIMSLDAEESELKRLKLKWGSRMCVRGIEIGCVYVCVRERER